MNEEKRYLSEKEVCEWLSISHNTAVKHFEEAITRIGRLKRYDRYKVQKILERR